MSGTDIQIDPSIVGGVNLNLHDKPLRYVFNRICGLTDIRYREKYGIVVFERDVPYAESYSVDFLDMSRNSSSSMSLNTSGLTSGSSDNANQVTGNGTSSVDTNSTDSFWDDIVSDIKEIIKTVENTHKIYTKTAQAIQIKAKEKQEKQEELERQLNGDSYQSSSIGDSKYTTLNDNSVEVNNNYDIRLNKRAGLVTVIAGTKAHRQIKQYFEQLKKKASAQVLIEMRFLEISLDKQYEAGIDWTNLNFGLGNALTVGTQAQTPTNQFATIVLNKGINATAHLFESFGSTRTLSNPRINAMNNQPALMSFATNNVYFKVTAENTTLTSASGTSHTVQNINAEPQTMPIGVILSVMPSINIDNGTIMLNIRPTISRKENDVQDPTKYSYIDEDDDRVKVTTVDNKIPVANVRELDTILKLKDGQTAVIGGFTERRNKTVNKGVPILRAIPLLGNLFSYKTDNTYTIETVILVKATIVNYGKKMSEYEEDIYNSFSDDPRMNELYD